MEVEAKILVDPEMDQKAVLEEMEVEIRVDPGLALVETEVERLGQVKVGVVV